MKVLCDGGCIYTLGLQPGTILRGNLLHDVHYNRTGRQSIRSNNGIFFDQGSKSFLVEGNVIYNTAGPPIRFNQCAHNWLTWGENHFSTTRARLGPGKIGSGLLCDGRNYVEAPHSPALDPEQLTVEAWIRLTAYPAPKKIATGHDNRRWIVNKNRNEWEEGHYGLVIRHDRIGAYLNIGGGRENCYQAWSHEGALKLNRWHHLAMTYAGAELKVYLDGAEVATTAINKKRVPARSPVAIGRRQDGYTTFKGSIDEVRIYNRALSAEEFKARHDKPTKVEDKKTEKGLVGYWSFDEAAKA
jgi:hypothetical protein